MLVVKEVILAKNAQARKYRNGKKYAASDIYLSC